MMSSFCQTYMPPCRWHVIRVDSASRYTRTHSMLLYCYMLVPASVATGAAYLPCMLLVFIDILLLRSKASCIHPPLYVDEIIHYFNLPTQLTAPSLVAAQCRSMLHQAASELSHAVDDLGNACGPQVDQAGLQRIAQQRKEFDKAVEELMRTMKELDGKL